MISEEAARRSVLYNDETDREIHYIVATALQGARPDRSRCDSLMPEMPSTSHGPGENEINPLSILPTQLI